MEKIRKIIREEIQNVLTSEEIKQMISKYKKEGDKFAKAYVKFKESGDSKKANMAKKLSNNAYQQEKNAREMLKNLGESVIYESENYLDFEKGTFNKQRYEKFLKLVAKTLRKQYPNYPEPDAEQTIKFLKSTVTKYHPVYTYFTSKYRYMDLKDVWDTIENDIGKYLVKDL